MVAGAATTWLRLGTQTTSPYRGPQPETLCHLFTERPVYRPDDGVHIKGYLRRRDKGELTPDRRDGQVIVQGPGDLVWRYPVELTEAGSFYKFFKEEKLPTGVYSAHFEDKDEQLLRLASPGAWRPTACRASRSASTRPTACRWTASSRSA